MGGIIMEMNYFREYINYQYNTNNIEDQSYKNIYYDIMLDNSITVELKTRFFTDTSKRFLEKNDILIELVQGMSTLRKNISDITVKETHTAVGWFYKCKAERLFYLKLLNNRPVNIIDIDFTNFFYWANENMDRFKINYSPKTTCTINAIVPIVDLPKNLYYSYAFTG